MALDIGSLLGGLLKGSGGLAGSAGTVIGGAAKKLEASQLRKLFAAHEAQVVQEMTAKGMTLDKPKHEVIRDIEFRLWRKLFTFPEGGRIADGFRDAQEGKVGAAVEAKWQPGWDLAAVVSATADETVRLVF